jgi:hydroxymethylpyrimidine/phosphomethylpyrimidine kinase
MAALSELTVVVEARERSGSLITAELAQQLNREVGAVPGRVGSSPAAGTNALLRDGATVIRGGQDVLDSMVGVGAERAPRLSGPKLVTGGGSGPAGAGGIPALGLRRPLRAHRAGRTGARVAAVTSLTCVSAKRRIPIAMTIATSDSGGGAGIQADLKAFARCGVHGTSAIVALTAQNTHEVISVETLPRQFILDQVRAVVEDMRVDAVKIGMLFDEPTIGAVDEALDLVGDAPIVLDPVMVAESGAVLLKPEAKRALIERIVPRATVVTPNAAEARELTGLGDDASPEELVRAVHALGPKVGMVTGGHLDGSDRFFDGEVLERIEGPRHEGGAAHGSGCTHSSALAARLALGDSPLEAARAARQIAAEAVANGLREIGSGAGPVDVLGIIDT